MTNPVALIDLDGTLADFEGSMRREMLALASPSERVPWDMKNEDSEPEYITARRRLVKKRPGFWRDLPVLQAGWDLLWMADAIGYDITILTKAPRNNPPAWMEKLEWCHDHLLTSVYDSIDSSSPRLRPINVAMVEDKGLVYGRMLIDDYPPYITSWLKHRPRGLVIMPAHDYNADFVHPNVIRYRGGQDDAVVTKAMEDQRDGIWKPA